jgi:hypothetical protein
MPISTERDDDLSYSRLALSDNGSIGEFVRILASQEFTTPHHILKEVHFRSQLKTNLLALQLGQSVIPIHYKSNLLAKALGMELNATRLRSWALPTGNEKARTLRLA